MNKGNVKEKKGIYIESKLWEQVDELLETANARSRNEFISQAIKFYSGYLLTGKAENYLVSSLSGLIHATVKDSENRLARAMFKLAVETSKLSHITAYSQTIDEATLNSLQAKCVEEVRRINGSIKFEEAYQYQKE